MNDEMRNELEFFVEQVVGPLRATMARKKRIRQELLAHLLSRFNEEVQRFGDERTAFDEAKRRFGDVGELSKQLQQAVPYPDQVRSILENMCYRPGESVWRFAAKHFLVMFTIYVVGIVLALLVGMPAFAVASRCNSSIAMPSDSPGTVLLGTAITLVWTALIASLNTVVSLVFASLLYRISTTLSERRRGRVLLVLFCGLMVPAALSCMLSGAAVVSAAMVRQVGERRRYEAAVI